MNDEKFDINCPHCGNVLECEEALLGEQVTCPCCNKNFVVRMPQGKLPGNKFHKNSSGEKSGSGNAYPWGRLYIVLARLLAVLLIISALCYIVNLLIQPFSNRSEALKTLKTERIPYLLEDQNKFQDTYIKTAELVLTGNNSSAKFAFPGDLVSPPGFFNEKLITEEDVRKSLNILDLYDEKIVRISTEMNNYFSRQYGSIFRLVNSGNPIKMSFNTGKAKKKSSGSIVMTFGQNADFYTNGTSKPGSDISEIRQMLNELEQRKKINQLRYQREVDTLRKGVDFIDERLNSEQKKFVTGSEKDSSQESSSAAKKVSASGKDQFRYEKYLLRNIILRLTRLSTPENEHYYSWLIAAKSKELRSDLSAHLRKLELINKLFKKALKAALLYSLAVLISGLFSAFFLLVIADYLQAHFDSAVSLKSIDGKMKNFLMLPILLLLFLTGCGESPAEVLKRDVSRLQNLAVDALFAEKISENSDATVYHVPGKELALISGGIKKITGTVPVTGGSYYNAQHVVCTPTVSVSAVEEYDKAPYTHRARLQMTVKYTIKGTDSDKNPDGTPGVTVNFLPPANFNRSDFNKDQWIDNKINEIPESELSHAVVLHNISKNKPIFVTEHKTFTVCYNSSNKAWEVENVNFPAATAVFPVYSEARLEQVMNGYNFKKLETTVNGTQKIFWFKDRDHEIADKIMNQGMVLDNGVWKKRRVVESTRDLEQKIKEWDDRSKVSLNDLNSLLQAIAQNPEAENHSLAISVAENALTSVFLQVADNPTEKDRKWLDKVQDFIRTSPYIRHLDKNKVESACKAKIEAVEKKIKEKEAFLSSQRKEIIAMLKQLDKAIKDFKSDFDVEKLSDALKQFPFILKEESYADLLRHWQELADIAMNKSVAVSTLYRNEGRCGNYMLLADCDRCQGSGLQSCRLCQNTGKCSLCHGRGSREITQISLTRGEYTTTLSCPVKCRQCDGRTKRCFRCRGGKYLNTGVLKEAFTAELDKLQQLIQKMQAEI